MFSEYVDVVRKLNVIASLQENDKLSSQTHNGLMVEDSMVPSFSRLCRAEDRRKNVEALCRTFDQAFALIEGLLQVETSDKKAEISRKVKNVNDAIVCALTGVKNLRITYAADKYITSYIDTICQTIIDRLETLKESLDRKKITLPSPLLQPLRPKFPESSSRPH